MTHGESGDGDSGSSSTPGAKHKLGYDPTWTDTFPWVIPIYEGSDSDSATTTTGLLCSLCRRHRTHQWNKSGTWAEKACTYLRKYVLERHDSQPCMRRQWSAREPDYHPSVVGEYGRLSASKSFYSERHLLALSRWSTGWQRKRSPIQ